MLAQSRGYKSPYPQTNKVQALWRLCRLFLKKQTESDILAKSTLKKRSDGRYAARIYLGTENGKKIYKTVYGKTAAEAEAKATELRAKLKKGIDIISYDDTYNQWASRLKAAKEVEMSESEWNTFIYRVKYFADEL